MINTSSRLLLIITLQGISWDSSLQLPGIQKKQADLHVVQGHNQSTTPDHGASIKIPNINLNIFAIVATMDLNQKLYNGLEIFSLGSVAIGMVCCILNKNGSISENIMAKYVIKTNETRKNDLIIHHTCPLIHDRGNKVRATLRTIGSSCPKPSSYVEVNYPPFADGKLAVCIKLSYKSMDTKLLIQWFEMQHILGVDKVFTLVGDDFYPEGREVFKYYEEQGYLHAHPFPGVPMTPSKYNY